MKSPGSVIVPPGHTSVSALMVSFVAQLVNMIVAPLLAGQDSIFGYLQKMNGLYFIPIFAVVLMGLWNRRTPPMPPDKESAATVFHPQTNCSASPHAMSPAASTPRSFRSLRTARCSTIRSLTSSRP